MRRILKRESDIQLQSANQIIIVIFTFDECTGVSCGKSSHVKINNVVIGEVNVLTIVCGEEVCGGFIFVLFFAGFHVKMCVFMLKLSCVKFSVIENRQ